MRRHFSPVLGNPPHHPSCLSRLEFPRESSVFFKAVDRAATKNDIADALKSIAADNGETLSDARADKLANKFKRGLFDPDLARFIQYRDPTGEEATSEADKALGLAA